MLRLSPETNVLVYGVDKDVWEKQRRALSVLEEVGRERSGPLPARALADFASVARHKLGVPPSPEEVFRQVELYAESYPIVAPTPPVLLEAVRGVRDHAFSYYDAQIWAAARMNPIPVILNEDFPIDSLVDGVLFLNPFEAEIDL